MVKKLDSRRRRRVAVRHGCWLMRRRNSASKVSTYCAASCTLKILSLVSYGKDNDIERIVIVLDRGISIYCSSFSSWFHCQYCSVFTPATNISIRTTLQPASNTMHPSFIPYRKAGAYIAKRLSDAGIDNPEVGIICGSGLSELSKTLEGKTLTVSAVLCVGKLHFTFMKYSFWWTFFYVILL